MSKTILRALQPRGPRGDVAVLEVDLGAHRLQALDVLVDRAQADRAAAGQRHARLAAARDQRPQHQDRGAHRLHELVGRERPVDARRVERDACPACRCRRARPSARAAPHRAHVVQPRHVGQRQRLAARAAPRTGSAAPRSWRPTRGPRRASGAPPSIASLSIAPRCRPLLRRERRHRQRVDLLAHAVAERRVDELVLRGRCDIPSKARLTISASK